MKKKKSTNQQVNHKKLIIKLEKLSNEMFKVGSDMKYYGGFGEMSQHGKELIGASNIVKDWIRGIKN